MAGENNIKGRIQLPRYTAAALKAANPVLLDGEIVYESDTERNKVGNGVTRWNSLPYAAGGETVPALIWKVQDGMLMVKAATASNNPILSRCHVGILHYKNTSARYRKKLDGTKKRRPKSKGYKLVDDGFSWNEGPSWTSVRIEPIPYVPSMYNEWVTVISVEALFDRWVSKFPNTRFAQGLEYFIHRGSNIAGGLTFGEDSRGQIQQKATIYCGVVLFIPGKIRTEGPRSCFKVFEANYGVLGPAIRHL